MGIAVLKKVVKQNKLVSVIICIVIGKSTRVNSSDARRRVVYYHKMICNACSCL
jgi:hypothetical protein